MTSALYQGTLWGAWITPVEAISGQPQKERLPYKLVDNLHNLNVTQTDYST